MKKWPSLFIAILASCSSSPQTTTTQVTADPNAPLTATASEPLPDGTSATDPLLLKAQTFDRYLGAQMDTAQAEAYLAECKANPQDNLFCFSVLRREDLDQKAKGESKGGRSSRKTAHVVVPHFRRHRMTNWNEVRSASVSAILKGLNTLSPSEMRQVRKLAAQEKKCPNNAAIAVAATLEDLLPDRIEGEEIGHLYEKGASCIQKNPSDKEMLLTRAGLFYFAKKNYRTAGRLFSEASTVADAFTARSLYWLYRTKRETKQMKDAGLALRELRTKYPFSFHTLVALITSNRDPGEILIRNETPQLKRSQLAPDVNSLIEQVELLHRFGFEQSASRVLDWAIADYSSTVEPEVRIYLSELKKDQGDYVSKITILSDVLYNHPSLISRSTMEQYFPKVFFPIFEKRAAGVDPYFLLAIARRESAFNSRAISTAKAQGLLQVMPATRNRMGLTGDLLDPESNVTIGAKYVQGLLQKVNGQVHLVLAAYNAGPNRVTTWTSRYPVADPVLFIDLIPFRETREYVASVLRNYYWYRRIHQGDDKITPERLMRIATSVD